MTLFPTRVVTTSIARSIRLPALIAATCIAATPAALADDAQPPGSPTTEAPAPEIPATESPAPAEPTPAEPAPAEPTPATPAPSEPAPATPAVEASPEGETVAVSQPIVPAHNIIQLEASTGAIGGIGLGALSLSYERMLTEFLSVRVGYGLAGGIRSEFGIGGGSRSTINAHGGFVMVHGLIFEGEHKLELGAGVGVAFYDRETTDPTGIVTTSDGTLVSPQASLAYRYQPVESGFFFRIGAMWTLAWGVPFGVGAGWTF